MEYVLNVMLGLAGFTVALFVFAGWWVAVRGRHRERKADRILTRAVDRCWILLVAAGAVAVVLVLVEQPVVKRPAAIALLFGAPLVWLWLVVLGMSWLELRVRGLPANLWRFHRFNLFAAFLLYGQRVPLVSAALAAPADLSRGRELVVPVFLYVVAAVFLGWILRFLLMTVVRVRPYPDRRLAVRVREVARTARVRLRGIFLVPTERGQSVNAIAATSSRYIFVAEGIRDGLDEREARAVLLHELGHLAQPVKNAILNAAGFGWPILIWGYRALIRDAVEGWGPLELGAVALVVGGVGSILIRMVAMASEREADRFAARWGPPGALASALVKMYEHGSLTPRPGHRHAVVSDRLGKLS